MRRDEEALCSWALNMMNRTAEAAFAVVMSDSRGRGFVFGKSSNNWFYGMYGFGPSRACMGCGAPARATSMKLRGDLVSSIR